MTPAAVHEVLRLLGTTDGSGGWYLWWSGIFSDAALFTGALVYARHRNCHVKGCWRPGHGVPGTPFTACRRHHPALPEGDTTAEHIAAAHAAAGGG